MYQVGIASDGEVPRALAEIHRAVPTGAEVQVELGGAAALWSQEMVSAVFTGAGFEFVELLTDAPQPVVTGLRLWSLPDYVGPDMKLLICGLNPSPGSADAGDGFHRAGNRFWPAAIDAGLVTRDRDPIHALTEHGVGMTDLVKRTTRRADELDKDEYRAGVERVTQLVEWLRPRAICMVGLAGWRSAVDRKAPRGWQAEALGGAPVYLMPSTSGLNAHDTVDTLAEHLRLAADHPPPPAF